MQKILSRDKALAILSRGEIHVVGQFRWGSNYTFLTEVDLAKDRINAVYKPSRGERPLWDFAGGTLASREVAAYLTSHTLGWDLVPATVLREDGPMGPGSVQLFVDADPEHHYFTFSEDEKARLKPVALFDLVINNADRKGGHILMSANGHLWSIDHGICFHEDDKLRTVIWDFAEQAIPGPLVEDVERLGQRLKEDQGFVDEYLKLISGTELEALTRRIDQLIAFPVFPTPDSEWSYPWPLV